MMDENADISMAALEISAFDNLDKCVVYSTAELLWMSALRGNHIDGIG